MSEIPAGGSDSNYIWDALLSLGLLILSFIMTIIGYLMKKRDEKLEQHDNDLKNHRDVHSTIFLSISKGETEIAERYATKDSLRALFQETQRTNEMAIARVEKAQDSTNQALEKTNQKVEKVADSVAKWGADIMKELRTKT